LYRLAIERCQRAKTRIVNHAAWRDHEKARDTPEGAKTFYFAFHHQAPNLTEEEAKVVDHYSAKMLEYEADLKRIERTLNGKIWYLRNHQRDIKLI
jgi:hypothetical protein